MPLKLYADECVHSIVVKVLRENGYSVEYISEVDPGINDFEVVKLVSDNSAILITEDSDFGEWVFVHGFKNVGVIFLRYLADELDKITPSILKIISKYKEDLFKKFIVITPQKIRIRDF